MPYTVDKKTKCVYKKKSNGSRGEKVGCTKGSLDDYLTALRIHAENKTMKKHKLKEEDEIDMAPGALKQVFAVQKPYSGCQLTSLVKPIDPLMGIGAGHSVVPDQVHSVFADKESALSFAEELFERHCQMETALEEKKEMATDKIKKSIDRLETSRKDLMNAIKEDPKNADKQRDSLAQLMNKLDDLMSKLEKIEKSKKKDQEESKKDKK